ncbi:ATP-binding protein [Acuticoccus kandeliae]|uniref:ATP-binding protein n=1 Tax=Acuticoccus kandeliae TaxID=2073160 RepID=UPI000D3E6B75|nr:ATP-binding protein [Acuticoccus kandeliae]
MSRPISLARRLGLGLALGVACLWLVATLVAGIIVRHELDEAFDGALQETAQRLLPFAVVDIVEREEGLAEHLVSPPSSHDAFLTYLVRDADGSLLLRSHDADPADFPARPMTGFRTTPTHRIYGDAAVGGTIVLEVAEPLEHRREAMFEAAAALLFPLVILVPLSLLGVWLLVRSALRPLRDFTAAIGARGGADLSAVPIAPVPAEIAPVAAEVNRLLDRLRRAFEAERSFSANSAHELRTPIAAGLAQAQRLVAEAPDGPLRERAERVAAAFKRLSQLAEKLMQLARAEGGGLVSEAPQDLAAILRHLVAEVSATADGAGRIALTLPDGGTMSRLDPDAFAIMVRNLIENGLRHGRPGAPVRIRLEDGIVSVASEGPAVPPETLASLTQRFERGAAVSEGSGLGLAIAEAIAVGAGGTLDLASPATGRADGFEVRIRLPEAAGPARKES